MGRYTTIRSEIWQDEEIIESDALEKLLYMYLLTGTLSNLIGYYKINPNIVACELGIDNKKILPMLIGQNKLWKYDVKTNQVFLPTYLKYNKLGGTNQLKSVNACLRTLTKCELHKNFLFSLNKYCGEESLNYIDREIKVYVKELCKNQESAIDITLYRLLNISN